jgi:ASC-1-like (ASCH) protein
MKVPKQLLTDLYISEVSCPTDKSHLEVFDSELRGFYVDLLASGRKSFRLRYRYEKKLRVVTLGDARILKVEEARLLVINLLRQAKQGVDPQAPAINEAGPLLKDFFTDKYLP